MLSHFAFKLAIVVVVVALCVAAVFAWRADQRDRAQLSAELAATKQLLAVVDSRQHDRDAQLAQTLAAITAEKRAVVAPDQIARELSKDLALPAPVLLQPEHVPAEHASSVGAALGPPAPNAGAPSTKEAGSPPTTESSPGGAIIPRADLKPLYDFTLDCQACQAKLAAAQSDLSDERTKTAALTKERDDALRIARGGSAWRRIGRAAKWFLIGAAAGAALSRAR
jgi:type II secretory pathway pseudopilin PulG